MWIKTRYREEKEGLLFAAGKQDDHSNAEHSYTTQTYGRYCDRCINAHTRYLNTSHISYKPRATAGPGEN